MSYQKSMSKKKVHSIYIGNLNYKYDEGEILGLFKKFGYIANIKIMREGKENKSKGFAFVDMTNLDEAKKAVEALNGKVHGGRTLKVSLAKTQDFKEKPKENLEADNRLIKKELDFQTKKERRKKRKMSVADIFSKK